jgi:sporulation protein YlmC with PRC-barrel domain
MTSRLTLSALSAAILAGSLPAVPALAGSCEEYIATAEERLAATDLSEQEVREINHMLESARMFLNLEREEACVNMVLEAEAIAEQMAAAPEIEERAAEELGRVADVGPLADVPAFRLIGHPIVTDGPEPVGEVVDVVVPEDEGGVRIAVLRIGGPLDPDSRTITVELDRLEPADFERLRVVDLTEGELRQLPEYDPTTGLPQPE